ncbi:MAG: ATP-binding cassette domain-containing protein [Leptospirales bacterium]|nr:ATP-binding cassette domain-containing protein [Leptospirales bacterium]
MRFDLQVRIQRSGTFRLEVNEQFEANALGIVGKSGSGKSTLLDAIAGIQPAIKLQLNGVRLEKRSIEGRRLAYVTQQPHLFPHLSVRRNLLYSRRASKMDDVTYVLGIAHLLDRMPETLSGGEARRVALARSILSEPELLLLDEPFNGLDEISRREAMSLLNQLKTFLRLPMVLVSHSADEVMGLTDWSLRLEDGQVTARGPTESILRQSETRFDNYMVGEVVGPGRVKVGLLELSVLMPTNVSGQVRLALYANDILLAMVRPEAISARNVFASKVVRSIPLADTALLVIEPGLRVLITNEASQMLGLKPGDAVFAIVKASSIVYLGPL